MTGNYGLIPEREPERWLPLPRKAAGAKLIQSQYNFVEIVTGNNNVSRSKILLIIGMSTI